MIPLPRPLTDDHHYLAAVVARLDTANALLASILDRLPARPIQDGGGTVELREPDQGSGVGPRLVEPALPAPPPRSGRGAGREAWAAYADRLGVPYPADAGRADIIAAVDGRGAAA